MITVSLKERMQSNIFPENEEILLKDETEFNKIVEHYSPVLFNIAIYITKQHQTAEDIVQEAFLRLWEKRVDIIPNNIGGWLHKVTSNLAYKYIKRESCRTRAYASLRAQNQECHTEVEEQLLQKENHSFMNDVYTRLPQKQRLVYRMSRKEGLSRYEIADQLNISPHTVKNHLAKAVQFIKDHASACCLFFLFFVFNNIFFYKSSTKALLKDLYKIEQRRNKNSQLEIVNSGMTIRCTTPYIRHR